MVPSAFVMLDPLPLVAQRQGGSQRPAGTRYVPSGTGAGVCGSAERDGTDAGRDLAGRSGRGPRGREGQLLRPGRRFDPQHPGAGQGPRGGSGSDPAELFQQQTIGELALVAGQGQVEAAIPRTEAWSLVSDEDRALLGEDVEDAYPLVELQAGMLFHSAYSPETAVYHDVFSCRLRAPLDVDRCNKPSPAARPTRRAANQLRLVGYRQPLQLVHRDVRVPLAVEDLRTLRARNKSAVEDWMEAEKQRPVRLAGKRRCSGSRCTGSARTVPVDVKLPSRGRSTAGAWPRCWPSCSVSTRRVDGHGSEGLVPRHRT